MLSASTCTRAWTLLGAFALIAGCGGDDGAQPSDSDSQVVAPSTPRADSLLDASAPSPDAASTNTDAAAAADAGDSSPDAQVVDDEPDVCPAPAPTSCPEGSPGYADIAPIVERRCVTCHSPRWNGPWPLHEVRHLRDWFDDVRVNLINCTMPPPTSDVKMTGGERRKLMQWVRCGMPN